MNVFEDLIGELKDENLLEDTVLEIGFAEPRPVMSLATPEVVTVSESMLEFESNSVTPTLVEDEPVPEPVSDLEFPTAAADETEFYRKRAIDEVSSLQMVEHVLSGIEREYLKQMPASYDDLEAKKALHRFLQVSGDTKALEYAEAEYALLHETEAWSTSLALRDQNISVANIRRYCENSRPVLSSQALMSLARFYRNCAYSESARGKFDFVMTRLFARECGDEKRRMLFRKAEMIGHIKTLYATWASVPLYSAIENESEIRAVAAKFKENSSIADASRTFDQLIALDYFGKVHRFKESLSELFFAPEVVAAAIESNVNVGNRFIDLIYAERQNNHPKKIEEKYGYTHDQIVSEAAAKTLFLVDVLRNAPFDPESAVGPVVEKAPVVRPSESKRTHTAESASTRSNFLALQVNRWLLASTILVAAVCSGLYFWAGSAETAKTASSASQIELADYGLNEYLRTGRATNTTLYAITLPAWDQLNEPQQKDVLKKAFAAAEKMGLQRVQLMNFKGRNTAFASKDRIDIQMQ
ncbi:MAG: hypothetical protein ABI539_00860 [Acidobacteriota bacterium]